MNLARARLVAQTIVSLFGQEARRIFAGETAGGSDVAADRRKQRAVAIREAMERLGPLYIKIGQMLSTRPDMVPDYMMAEFEQLHDRVTPTPFSGF